MDADTSTLIQPIVDAVNALIVALEPSPREMTSFEVDLGTVVLVAGRPMMMVPEGIHLPGSSQIRAALVENFGTTALLSVYIGSNGMGRLLRTVAAGKSVIIPVPDGVTSLSIVASGAANDTGLVRTIITTDPWAPISYANA